MNQEHTDSSMVMVEANLDDMTGEWMGYVLERMFENGARDAFFTPIIMKKNRPAYKLSVLVSEKQLEGIKTFLFKETTTLGVRYYPVTCHRLEREFIKVEIPELGSVIVKIGIHQGDLVQMAPEYEDCANLARIHGVPLKVVYDLAIKAADSYSYLGKIHK